MDAASLPETIRTIIDQAGGLGLRGAFTYIGASQFCYRCAEPHGEYRSASPSRLTSENGPPLVCRPLSALLYNRQLFTCSIDLRQDVGTFGPPFVTRRT